MRAQIQMRRASNDAPSREAVARKRGAELAENLENATLCFVVIQALEPQVDRARSQLLFNAQ